ncbi:MAG: cytochrome C [Deltaproteobacteria bacterium]|nr:cytochrome C [Deltaproteobacteria bacterium]
MKRLAGLVICGGLLCVNGAWAAAAPSLKSGQELFASDKLGTSGKSCDSCHPGGKGLNISAVLSDDDLADTINGCIAGPLKGKPLAPESADMKSLLLYLKSLAGAYK